MSEGLLPPFVDPTGVRVGDEQVLDTFAAGEHGCWSDRFHLEGPALIGHRMAVVGLRIGPSAVLVRTDPPDELEPARIELERALERTGLSVLDEETLWATPVALQVLGLRISTWNLWGRDLDAAFEELRTAAAGEEASPVFDAGPVGGWE